ncbi:MAG: PAS domain-containing protein [Rhodospirillales bacterium]|nr:MAG: PAS domain-containing protein [Rhodospirillales bacterium]
MVLSSILSTTTHPGDVLDAIADNSLSSVMVTQAAPDTPIIYVNEAFTTLTGYTPEDVIGKSPRMLQGPKTDQAVLDRLRKDLEAGRIFEGETVNYRKDCSEFVMHWRVFPVRDQQGAPVYFVALQEENDT